MNYDGCCADRVVGATGPAFKNIIFCRPNMAAPLFMPASAAQWSGVEWSGVELFYWLILERQKLDYREV